MDRKVYQGLIALCCLWLAACKKDKPDAAGDRLPGSGGNVYVVCEGNLGSGQASLYAYHPDTDSAFGDLYRTANNAALGDVFQSMLRIDNTLFLCINNSDKLVALNSSSWKTTGSLRLSKPRYMLPVSATRAYVTSEFGHKVYVINPTALTITDTLTLPFVNTEGLCYYNGYAFICCWDTACAQLYKIDAATGKVAQTIPLPGRAPQEVLLDKEQMLWVLAGNEPYGCTATLTRIDPSTGAVLAAYRFPATADPFKPVFNSTKDTIYFLEGYNSGNTGNGVYRMDIHAAALPQQAFISQHTNQYFWALGIEPASNRIYVADAKDFNQKATVYIYRPDGTQVSTFNVGPGPGHFYFDL